MADIKMALLDYKEAEGRVVDAKANLEAVKATLMHALVDAGSLMIKGLRAIQDILLKQLNEKEKPIVHLAVSNN